MKHHTRMEYILQVAVKSTQSSSVSVFVYSGELISITEFFTPIIQFGLLTYATMQYFFFARLLYSTQVDKSLRSLSA